jgi:hypothetical protein
MNFSAVLDKATLDNERTYLCFCIVRSVLDNELTIEMDILVRKAINHLNLLRDETQHVYLQTVITVQDVV